MKDTIFFPNGSGCSGMDLNEMNLTRIFDLNARDIESGI